MHPSRCPARVSPAGWIAWPCLQLLSSLSAVTGGVFRGRVRAWIILPTVLQCWTVAHGYLQTGYSLLSIGQVMWQPDSHHFLSPPSWGFSQRIALQLAIHSLRPVWSILRCKLLRKSVTQVRLGDPCFYLLAFNGIPSDDHLHHFVPETVLRRLDKVAIHFLDLH